MSDIKSMPAGRELDDLISEKIFGHVFSQFPRGRCYYTVNNGWVESPNYSTSWNGMRLMIGEIHRRGLAVYLGHHPDGKSHAMVVKDAIETLGDAESESAPHAVCIAALLALGVEHV